MHPKTDDVVGGKYRIVRLIGDGGMGAVFEARHQILGSPVALKFLHSELASRPGLSQRFLQEARVSASIQSPHVTRVTDVDQTPDGAPYLVMELLTGESLQQLLDRELKLDQDRALDYALQILAGVEAAHALGVVHRDLKPDNVFVTPSAGGPVLKLLDFGIAKLRDATSQHQKGLTRPGAVMGTPEYMAPEQLYTADQADHRADIYSVGAMLYEMLSGQRPADGDDAPSIIAQVAQGMVVDLRERVPGIAEGLARAVHKALEPQRDHRMASATGFRLALAPFAGQLSHAGRLAATPTPSSVISDPRDSRPDAPPHTRQLPAVGAAPAGGVAPTLPPDDTEPEAPVIGVERTDPDRPAGAASAKGSTQDAPSGVIGQITAQSRVPSAGPYALSPGAYPALAAPTAARRRSASRALGVVLALLLGLLVTGAVIAMTLILRQRDDSDRPPLPTIVAAPPATVTPAGGSTVLVPPLADAGSWPPATVPPRARTPVVGGGSVTPRPSDPGVVDAGETAQPEAGAPTWQIPGLPPIPSSFPTALPSTWPTIPGIGPPP